MTAAALRFLPLHASALQQRPAPRAGHTPARTAVVRRLRPAALHRRSLRTRATVSGQATTTATTDVKTSLTSDVKTFDFLVLGSGIAGLSYALKVAEYGSVAVVTKGQAFEGCTQYAQGGICAVLDAHDSPEAHIQDTLVAGDFLNSRKAVEAVCREGPGAVLELAELGAKFTRGRGGALHLTREGGHSARRIVHAADATGREVERALLAAAAAKGNITFYEHHLATDLVLGEAGGAKRCLGVDALDQRATRMTRFIAPVTLLATGGAGQVYPLTTNPSVATGDGMAMAFRAKAAVANLEFVQFHPTAFCPPEADAPGSRAFLISEAVRGEGGRLYNAAGHRFMKDYDARLELAPRDIVARAIHSQLAAPGAPGHVLLDISHMPSADLLAHFPTIAAACLAKGVDITRGPIPVAPAQHYMCGGVQTGLHGETTVPGLFAVGEVACTGLHGANRLASNSLLEGLVFAARAVQPSIAAAEVALASAGSALQHASAHADFTGSKAPMKLAPSAAAWVLAKRNEVTSIMARAGGIVRRRDDMKAALQSLATAYVEAKALLESYGVAAELVELRNLVTVGELILASALRRRESRGGHFCLDHPAPCDAAPRNTIVDFTLFPSGAKAKAGKPVPRGLAKGGGALAKGAGAGRPESGRPRQVALRSRKEDVA